MQQARYHLIVDLDHCDERILNPELVKQFVIDAVEMVGMKIIGGPIVCEGVPENPGFSSVAVLDFSHISVHTFSDSNEAMVDIFSCKPFEQSLAIDAIRRAFATPESTERMQVVFWG